MFQPSPRRLSLQMLVSLVVWLPLFACSRSDSSRNRAAVDSVEPGVERSPSELESEVVVFAAASLRDVFGGMATTFEGVHPGKQVVFNFAGTHQLRMQLEQGASADVFASADQKHMDALLASSRVVSPAVFTRNEPVLVVADEAVGKIRSFADLPNASSIVIGAKEVPIGRYTLEILDRAAVTLGTDFRARVEAKVVSRELNVRQVLSKVSLGEAQAGVVYRTDVTSAQGEVKVVPIPQEFNVVAEYPIAEVKDAAHPSLARAWVDLVFSEEGQAALRDAGFIAPAGSVSSR